MIESGSRSRPDAAAAREAVDCAHCGLPVPPGRTDPIAELQFCCSGCELVHDVIHRHGLERYYRVRQRQDADGRPARVSGRTYAEYDATAFRELYVRPLPGGLLTTELYLEGVHCAACVWLIERTPIVVPGVAEVRVDLQRSMARVAWDPEAVRLSELAAFVDSLGYAVHPYRGVELRDVRRREDRSLLIRIGVAGFSAGNVMLMAFAMYGGLFHGMEAEFSTLFRWGSLLVAAPAVLWSAGVFYRGTWASLRTGTLHMDVPITIGIVAGSLSGAWNTFTGRGEIYFDSVTLLILLLLIGRWLQRRQQRRAADAAELLFSLTPSSARVVDGDGVVREVPVQALAVGARVEVRPGDSVPVDGVVERGRSDVDAALLTGESKPLGVSPGDRVHAGTTNLTAPFVVRVDATGEHTRVGRLMQLVEEAARRRAPIVQLADRISGWFVAAVLALASLTLVAWSLLDPSRAVEHAIALLVVTCPCALGLATPLAVSAAVGRASRNGILIKGADVLERLAGSGRILLDKTGTLTEGRAALVRWIGDDAAKPLVAALESAVTHPVATALVEAFGDHTVTDDVEVLDARGGGVRGRVGRRDVLAGSPGRVAEIIGELPGWCRKAVRSITAAELTPVVVAVDGVVCAVAGVGDRVRADAEATVRSLRAMGWEIEVQSGDHPSVVRTVARRVGIDPDVAHGGRLPEDKLDAVERAVRESPTVMVGDGVNDAAALSAATVGVAVHGGAEAAMAAADVFLSREGLRPLADLFEGANRTLRVIRLNLVLSLLYNVAGAGLAMAGLIGPLAAAVLMPLSSLTVISISYRARTFS